MIANIQIDDKCLNPQTMLPTVMLKISFVKKDGELALLSYEIPESMRYNWVHAGPRSQAEPGFLSWNGKPVKKTRNANGLSETRVNEIIYDLVHAYPEAGVINELNIPNTAFCDIEVDVTDDGFPDAVHAANPVNTISWVYGTGVTVLGRTYLSKEQISDIQKKIDEHCTTFNENYTFQYVYYEDERKMLIDFFRDYMGKVPCVTGWNFFGYDYPYLYNRSMHLGIDMIKVMMTGIAPGSSEVAPEVFTVSYNPQNAKSREERLKLPGHKMLYDYMEIYAKWDRVINPKESNKLDWVAEKALGVRKVEHQLGFKALWEQEPVLYVFYNAIDSVLVREIDKKLKTSKAFFSLANLLHVPALIAFSPVRSLEAVQTEYLYKENRIFPIEKKESKAEDETYEGAFVYDPVPGVYKNVIALDFASLYPSTMRQFNISPDTFICKDVNRQRHTDEIKTVSGAVYRRNEEGFIPKILTDFYAQRKAFKKEMLIAEREAGELKAIYERRFSAAI